MKISIPVLAGIVARYIYVILALALISGGVAYVRGRGSPLTYSASETFTPQTRKSTGNAGLAAQLGLTANADQAQSPQYYVALINSREIRRRTALSRYFVNGADSTGVDLATALKYRQTDPHTRLRAAMAYVAGSVNAAIAQPTGLITITATSTSPALAAQIAARVVEAVDAFNRENARTLARQQRDFTQQGLQDYRDELRAAEERLQQYLHGNRDAMTSPTAGVERDRLARDVQLRQQMYTSVLQAYEQARLEESRDAPQLTIIDPAEVPDAPDPRGVTQRVKLAILMGAFVGLVLVFLGEGLALATSEQSHWYRSFVAARRSGLNSIGTDPNGESAGV